MTQAYPAPTTWGARVPVGIGPPSALSIVVSSPAAGPDLTKVTGASCSVNMPGVPPNAPGSQTWSLALPPAAASWQPGQAYAQGAYVQPNPANGSYYVCTVAGTSGTVLSGTASVTNGQATVTFSTAQTLLVGQEIFFASQPGVPYYLAAAVVNDVTATLTTSYGGTTASATTTTLPPIFTISPGDVIPDGGATWKCVGPVTSSGQIVLSHAFASGDCPTQGPYQLSVALTVSGGTIPCYASVLEVVSPYELLASPSPSLTLQTSVVF